MVTLPEAKDFHNLSNHDKTRILDNLFEPCPTLTSILIEKLQTTRPYHSYQELIERARYELLEYLKAAELQSYQTNQPIRPEIAKIIAAHPRLGVPKTIKLSDYSSHEQKSLQGSPEETERLASLNQQYELAFPGLRYIVFVNGRSRSVIMENMRQRITRHDIKLERREAFNAMCDIALDRANKLGAKL